MASQLYFQILYISNTAVLVFRVTDIQEIIQLKKVTALDLKLSGTIRMTLADGSECFVSRRYVKKIKQALGL